MLGVTRGVTASLVGWLWADILLGLFVIFLAASSAPSVSVSTIPTPPPNVIDPTPLVFTVPVQGQVLLAGAPAAIAAEQERIATELAQRQAVLAPGRRVAMVLGYGANEDPQEGERLVRAALTAAIRSPGGAYANATIKIFHDLVPGDRGTSITVEVYLYQQL